MGLEAAGTVEAVGGGVTDFSPGERVFALLGGGGYAELASAYAGHVMKMPPNLSFEQAACICETYITAHMNLFGNARLHERRDGVAARRRRRRNDRRDGALPQRWSRARACS